MAAMIDSSYDRSSSGIKYLLRLLTIMLMTASVLGRDSDSCHSKLNNCTQMVKPYLQNVRYMFPTTAGDVDEMCKIWSFFVDCVRQYIVSCFSDERRSQFNSAVENSVDTVHAICSSESVQKEYLSNAECFRKVSVDKCGSYYAQLVDHVSNPKSHDDHICCSYSQFRECVHDPLLRECGNRARNLMDHSMAFLITRCRDKSHFRLDQRCPSPPPIIDSHANAQRITDQTDTGERQDRSSDTMSQGTYDHQTAEEQGEGRTSSGGRSSSGFCSTLQLLLVLITARHLI